MDCDDVSFAGAAVTDGSAARSGVEEPLDRTVPPLSQPRRSLGVALPQKEATRRN